MTRADDGSAVRRRRPHLHFTPVVGWNNDPHGIVFADGRYHLFFQYNPRGTVWSEACHWGHATSVNLVVWEEQDVALSPESGEVGCWSGSVVFDGDVPTIVYTRIAGEDWSVGQIALARGSRSLDAWWRDPPRAIVDGPPAGLDVIAFRDPFVWRDGDAWRMVIGTGTRDGTAALVQYTSPDLVDWTYAGLAAQRHTSQRYPVWTGTLWECPQLFELDGTWVLLVSVWDDDVLHHVCYALGDYDGRSFVPRTWGRFSHGNQLYATSTFVDAEGRRCVMSWLRERDNAPRESDYAGALSLPHVLSVQDERLTVRQHPNLGDHVLERRRTVVDGARVDVGPIVGPCAVELDYDTGPGGSLSLVFGASTGDVLAVNLDRRRSELTVEAEGDQLLRMPIGRPPADARVHLVIDGDVLEALADGTAGVGATRIPDVDGSRLAVLADDGFPAKAVTVSRLGAAPG